jgi:tetratricopeptide (TPR) repeat protein
MTARVDGVCRGCHATLPAKHADAGCASCHMPRRRTQDVVQVLMTDHRIQRGPGGPELLAPRAERDPVLTELRILDPAVGPLSEIYRAAAVVRAAGSRDAARFLERKLPEVRLPEPDPWLDLAQAQLNQRRFTEAEITLAAIRERRPDDLMLVEWLALARAGQGKLDEAIELTRSALARGSDRVEAEYNLGRLLAAKGAHEEAAEHLSRAVALKPNLVLGWFYLGEVRTAQGRKEEAAESYRRALEIDPGFRRAAEALGDTDTRTNTD